MKTIHRITLRAGNCSTSVQKFRGKDHLVVPIVAMVGDSVVNPSTSEYAEFVPADALRLSAPFWSGKPVYCDHPGDKNELGNSKHLLETECIGIVLNPRFEGGNLKLEAWIDIARCEELADDGNDDALEMLEKCRTGEMGEISIGAGVMTTELSGTTDSGVDFDVTWDIGKVMPDHLAMLPEGITGACSVGDGCGSVRMKKRAKSNHNEDKAMGQHRTFVETVRALLAKIAINAEDQGESDSQIIDEKFQLERVLGDALMDTVPAFQFVADTFQDSSTVVYTTFTSDFDFIYTRCVYSIEEEDVSFSDCEEVVPREGYDPVLNRQRAPDHKKDDFEQWYSTSDTQDDKIKASQSTEGDDDMAKKVEAKKVEVTNSKECNCETVEVAQPTKQGAFLARKLIELRSDVAGDENHLAMLSESTLEQMIKDATPVVEPVKLTDEEWRAQAPESILSVLTKHEAATKKKRTETISALAECQKEFDNAALEEMGDEMLSKLLVLSGKTAPTVLSDKISDKRFAAQGMSSVVVLEGEVGNVPVVSAFSAFPKLAEKQQSQ